MTWYPIAFLPPQYENASGTPYSGAVLKAYSAQSTTNIPLATSYLGTTTAASIALNASGYPVYGGNVIIPHVQENYKLMLYPTQAAADANSGELWMVDDIQISESTNTPFIQYFDGDGSNATFTLSQNLGNDENILMVFADRKLPEYQTNGTFAVGTGWTLGAGWSIGSGVATAAGAISTDMTQNAALPVIAGMSYTIQFDVTRSAGGVIPKIGGTSGTERTATGTYKETIIAGSTQAITFSGNAFTGTVDNVTVKPTYGALRQILRPDEYTLTGNSLVLNEIPPTGTKNIIVFAPSLLLGAAAASAAAAATSEANALTSANNANGSALAAAASATTAATAASTATTQASNASTSATNASTSATNASTSAAAAAAYVDASANKYVFSTSTSMADPGTGIFRFNNATLASATAIAISELTGDPGNPDIGAYMSTWDDSTNTVKGQLLMRKAGAPATFAVFALSTLSDNSAWEQLTVTHVAHNGTFSDGDIFVIEFLRAGDKGTDGAGSGDMLLASAQSVTGLKTFDKDKLAMKGTSTGVNTISVANTSASSYTNTIPAKAGTFAMTSDVSDAAISVTDITTNNATTSAHGFMPKGTGATNTFFCSDMTQKAISSSGSDLTTITQYGGF